MTAPRAVLREFGTELPADVEVRVWDSSAAIRYLVLPGAPARHRGAAGGRAGGDRSPATRWSASAADPIASDDTSVASARRSRGRSGRPGSSRRSASAASKARKRHSPARQDAVALGVTAGGEVERAAPPSVGEHARQLVEAHREHLDVAAARLVVAVRRRHVALAGELGRGDGTGLERRGCSRATTHDS